MKRPLSIALLLLFLLTRPVGAAQTLTTREAIARALEKNHLIKAAEYSLAGTRQEIGIANARYFPGIVLEETLAASNSSTQTFMMKLDEGRFTQNDFQVSSLNNPSASHDFKTALTIQQPLYVPSFSPLKEIAVKETEIKELELEATRQEIAFQVFKAVLEVRKSDSQLQAADKAVIDARENVRLAHVRQSAGVGLRSDELRARTHLSQMEQLHITARNNRELAGMQLALLIGFPEDQMVELAVAAENIVVPALVESTFGMALGNRTDMKRSHSELEKSTAALKLAKNDVWPSIGAFASYQMNGKDAPFSADSDAWAAGITLKWQLFDGFRRYHERDRAVAGRSAAVEMQESRARDIRYQVRESYLRRDESVKRLEVARLAQQDAEETVRLLVKRFENSLATMAELLDAQTALNQARAGLVESETGLVLAQGRINYTTGIFLKEIMK